MRCKCGRFMADISGDTIFRRGPNEKVYLCKGKVNYFGQPRKSPHDGLGMYYFIRPNKDPHWEHMK